MISFSFQGVIVTLAKGSAQTSCLILRLTSIENGHKLMSPWPVKLLPNKTITRGESVRKSTFLQPLFRSGSSVGNFVKYLPPFFYHTHVSSAGFPASSLSLKNVLILLFNNDLNTIYREQTPTRLFVMW